MKGDKKIPIIVKPSVVFKKPGNALIKKANREWIGKLSDEQLGTLEFTGADDKVTATLALKTLEIVVCDASGNQYTAVVAGYIQQEM